MLMRRTAKNVCTEVKQLFQILNCAHAGVIPEWFAWSTDSGNKR